MTAKTKKTDAPAFTTTVLPDWPRYTDQRLTRTRFNDFAVAAFAPATREEADARAAWVRGRMLLAAGLAPWPEKTPLNARVWGEFEHEGCLVSKAQFESAPGFLVTGNLYRPLKPRGKAPAVLCPHGHWPNGRVHHEEKGSIPNRCVMLARLGCVVFAYDMVGYNDSRQVMHRWPLPLLRQAALHGLSPFGLQLWNSVRAVDFVSGLPGVDARRIGCTGASGGGTQTWTLALADDRVTVAAPVCMLSCHYQGGCVCENGPLQRIDGCSSFEIVAALAPRPVFLPSVTQDWTNLNPQYELPRLKAIYRLYGAEERVAGVHLDAPHNYNKDTREHVYGWLVKWLLNGGKGPLRRVAEPRLEPLPVEKALIFPPRTEETTEKETRQTLAVMARRADGAFAQAPRTAAERRAFRRVWAQTYAETLGVCRAPEDVAVRVTFARSGLAGFSVAGRVLSRRGVGDLISALWITRDDARPADPVTLVLTGDGKAGLFDGAKPTAALKRLLAGRQRVLAVDLVGQGDTASSLKRAIGEQDDTLYYAHNMSLLAMRVQDALTALAALRQCERPKALSLAAQGEGARVALLALPLAGKLSSASLDFAGVDCGANGWKGEAYHPLILKVGGLKTALALADTPVKLAGADAELARWARDMAKASR